nr:branchpoint-bridging protein-like [Aegilops tauschii subsp. strangulata]
MSPSHIPPISTLPLRLPSTPSISPPPPVALRPASTSSAVAPAPSLDLVGPRPPMPAIDLAGPRPCARPQPRPPSTSPTLALAPALDLAASALDLDAFALSTARNMSTNAEVVGGSARLEDPI